MKQKNSSIKWKIFFYLFIFGAVMLSLLWIFQVVFLDDFYKIIKTKTVSSSSDSVIISLQNEDYIESLNQIAVRNDVCITLYDNTQQLVYSSDEYQPQCKGTGMLRIEEIAAYVEEARNNNGETFSFHGIEEKDFYKEDIKKSLPFEEESSFIFPKGKFMQGMTQVSITKAYDEKEYTIFVYSQITPVDATVGTIRTQLLIITGILFLFAVLLAFIMSKKIARPIIKITNNAKKLVTGEYDVEFQGQGYLEIAELNNTLNYVSKELSKVEKLRQDLIANMSHDLRTPLTMISGYGEMMRDIPNENSPENIQIIIDETNRLTSMVNDILDLSKIQSGTQKLTISCFNITNMIQHDIKRYQKMMEHESFQFIFDFQEEAYVHGDESKLNQVLYNLINNAIHYSGEDKQIVIRQSMLEHKAKIEVIDHGDGISEKDLPYVWDRYYKVDKIHERTKIGSGLGLSIVKGILELHQCEYGVTSKENEGTIFWFCINR